MLITGLIVAIVLVGSVLIPFLFEVYARDNADVQLEMGQVWEYTPTTSIQAELTLTGSASNYAEWDGDKIVLTLPSGGYSLTINADSVNPTQHAEQTITFYVGDVSPTLTGLMFTVPTLLIVGFVIFVIRRLGISDGSGDSNDYYNY